MSAGPISRNRGCAEGGGSCRPLSSEFGTNKTVKAWLAGKSPCNILRCWLFARKRIGTVRQVEVPDGTSNRKSSNEPCYSNALILLVRMNLVVMLVVDFGRKMSFPDEGTGRRPVPPRRASASSSLSALNRVSGLGCRGWCLGAGIEGAGGRV